MSLQRSIYIVCGSDDHSVLAEKLSVRPDVFCLDLEDSVLPERKVFSRGNVVEFLNTAEWGDVSRCVRINATDSPHHYDDLTEVVEGSGGAIDRIMLPMVETSRQIWWVHDLLDQLEKKNGFTKRIKLDVVVETPLGMTRINEIASASDRIGMLSFGVGDLSVGLGTRLFEYLNNTEGYPGDLWHYARFNTLIAARAAGVPMVDPPWVAVSDLDGLTRDAYAASIIGCSGKMAVAPEQVSVINAAFTPTDTEVVRAKKIISDYEQVRAGGRGADIVDGEEVGLVTLELMQDIVRRAEAAR